MAFTVHNSHTVLILYREKINAYAFKKDVYDV